MTQRNQDYGISPNDTVMSPARNVFLITPHATNEITPLPKAVRFDGAGVVTLRTVGASADVTVNVVAGETLDWRVQYIRTTGSPPVIHGLA